MAKLAIRGNDSISDLQHWAELYAYEFISAWEGVNVADFTAPVERMDMFIPVLLSSPVETPPAEA